VAERNAQLREHDWHRLARSISDPWFPPKPIPGTTSRPRVFCSGRPNPENKVEDYKAPPHSNTHTHTHTHVAAMHVTLLSSLLQFEFQHREQAHNTSVLQSPGIVAIMLHAKTKGLRLAGSSGASWLAFFPWVRPGVP
jgi:hypothetical protein